MFLCDVDGVLADWLGHLLRTVASNYEPEDITEYGVFDKLEPIEKAHAEDILRDPQWWASIPPKPFAQEGLESLTRVFNTELLVVSRPWPDCPDWTEARAYWLSKNFPDAEFHFEAIHRKELLHSEVLVDDHPETLVAWKRLHPQGTAVCFDAPYNRGYKSDRRITWSKAGPVWIGDALKGEKE